MTLRTLALTSFAASALVLAGCAYDTDHHGASAQIEPSHNLLGIVTTSPGSYLANNDSALSVSTSELWGRRDVSGDNITFLWGALSISDY